MNQRWCFAEKTEFGGAIALLSQEGSTIEPSEIVRGEVPKPHPYKVCLGTSARATLSGRAALLTQEGNRVPQDFDFAQSL